MDQARPVLQSSGWLLTICIKRPWVIIKAVQEHQACVLSPAEYVISGYLRRTYFVGASVLGFEAEHLYVLHRHDKSHFSSSSPELVRLGASLAQVPSPDELDINSCRPLWLPSRMSLHMCAQIEPSNTLKSHIQGQCSARSQKRREGGGGGALDDA